MHAGFGKRPGKTDQPGGLAPRPGPTSPTARAETIRFVDEHKDRFGVEPIVSVLRATDAGFLSVSGFYAAKTRPPSARQAADKAWCEQIRAVHEVNYSIYGVRRMHDALQRAGAEIGRDHLARLMRWLGLQGCAGAGRTHHDRRQQRGEACGPAQAVHRSPTEQAVGVRHDLYPHLGRVRLPGPVIDVYSRRLAGWAVTTHMRTDLPLQALEMAISARDERLDGLVHHSDAQYTAIRYTDALTGASALPSIDSVGDSYDS